MALTNIETVYRDAADMIGEISITDASDHDVKPYSTCAYHYEQARDEMIRGYAWNEATELALCLQDAETPKHTWTYRFALPTDHLRSLCTTRPRDNWRVLGDYVYTNYKIMPDSYTVGKDYYTGQYLSKDDVTYLIGTDFTATVWATDSTYCTSKVYDYGYVELEYVKELADPTNWSVQLRQAIVLNLATKIAVPLSGSHELRKSLLEELHRLVLPYAFVLDAMQGKPKQFFYSNITDARGQ